jgi:hypothetical protein
MLRRSLVFSLLIASATCRADEVPAGEPMASATSVEHVQNAAAQSGSAQDERAKGAPAHGKSEGGDKALSGMSILGNQEAPKSLVIVPWKSSELGDTLGLAESLDDSRRPVDKEVFMRELDYYEIRSE